MSKRAHGVIWATLAVAACSSNGLDVGEPPPPPQPAFTLIEVDQDGGRHPVQSAGAIVDINSTLQVAVDADVVRTRLLRRYGPAPIAPGIRKLLNSTVAELQDSVPKMAKAVDSWNASGRGQAEVDALDGAMESVGQSVLTILGNLPPQLAGAEAAFEARLPAAGGGLSATMRIFHEVIAEALEDSRLRELQALREHGVVVRFGAWTTAGGGLRPVHLEGFDTHQPGAFFEVERIVLAMTEEQRAEWSAIVTRARSLNRDPSLQLDAKAMARNLAAAANNALAEPIAALERELGAAREALDNPAQALQDAVDRIAAAVQRARAELVAAKTKCEVIANGQDLDLAAALPVLADLRADALRLRDTARALVAAVAAEVATIQATLADAAAKLQAAAAKLRSLLDGLAAWLPGASAAAAVNVAALRFGEEVLALDVQSLPNDTQLDLRYTGEREAGDRVVFLMRGGPKDQPQESHMQLGSQQATMFQVLTHARTAVSLTFANPSGQLATMQNDFHAAPSYNLLLKPFGTRHSPFVNRFLDPGIGLSLAALDFDGDDSLDLGVGGTVTLFHDWIQAGYGYDLGTDRDYWFFGLSLPLTDIALPR